MLTDDQYYSECERISHSRLKEDIKSFGRLEKKTPFRIPAFDGPEGRRWLHDAKLDIPDWSAVVEKDSKDRDVDWEEIRMLDLANGVGVGVDCEDSMTGLVKDQGLQDRLHSLYDSMYRKFQYGAGRDIESYRLARAISFANRRLGDEIALLSDRVRNESDEVPESPLEADERRRNEEYKRWRSRQDDVESGAITMTDDEMVKERRRQQNNARWLPGQDVDTIINLDFETTGNADLGYVIDAGWDFMDISPTMKHEDMRTDADKAHEFRQDWYKNDGAYDIQTRSYGVPVSRAKAGNPFKDVNHIDLSSLKEYRPLDEDPEAQAELLDMATSGAPIVAHNARFEMGQLAANVDGFMEAYRDGDVTFIDTMRTSQMWPLPKELEDRKKNDYNGSNSLDTYMKLWDVIPEDESELHLGLEDAHGMGVALKRHLAYCHSHKMGPWNTSGPVYGVGGKHMAKTAGQKTHGLPATPASNIILDDGSSHGHLALKAADNQDSLFSLVSPSAGGSLKKVTRSPYRQDRLF